MIAYYEFWDSIYNSIYKLFKIGDHNLGLFLLISLVVVITGVVLFCIGSVRLYLLIKSDKGKRRKIIASSSILILFGFILTTPMQLMIMSPIVRNIKHEKMLEQSFEYAFKYSRSYLTGYERAYEHVRTHLENGADPVGEDPDNPLIAQVGFAGNIVLMELLLEYGADPNATSENDEMTLLMFAAWYNYEDRIELLLKYGADVNIVGYQGNTALDYAYSYKKNYNGESKSWGKDRGTNEWAIQALIEAGAVRGEELR